jgi:hypothetical protein
MDGGTSVSRTRHQWIQLWVGFPTSLDYLITFNILRFGQASGFL